MKVLALNPYHGGSHAAFLDGWRSHSRHAFTIVTLPPHKWKWRMRHGAVTLAARVNALAESNQQWDALWTTSMLNLAEFKGLTKRSVADLPAVVYFHENQLTYPLHNDEQRDLHLAYSQFTSALAAAAVWFNRGHHRDTFCDAMRAFLRTMPDPDQSALLPALQNRSTVHYPPIPPPPETDRKRGQSRVTPHLLWAARWEYDKNPALLLEGLIELEQRGFDFKLSVIGQRFRQSPPEFEQIQRRFAGRLACFGYLESRDAYEAALTESDVFISTADHEFFGIAAVEAAARGCAAVLPERLAYPEVFGDRATWYDGSAEGLADAVQKAALQSTDERDQLAHDTVERFGWPARAGALDDALDAAARREMPGDDLT